ncbi:unnamed protein product [Sphenostylis stenocarpa]|uniref:Pectinesterase n=1 Tax=Sphenostylis stenocarpa TaxID=92480 RepID=A0AA86SBF6_9FABA|nr:unnamed protein product [Sphenostylis stenocarpa]
MVVAVTVSVNFSNKGEIEDEKEASKSHVASSMKAVKTLCAPTEYQKECEDSLNANAGNVTDPRELIKIVFNVTFSRISDGLGKTQLMQEAESDPRTKEALDTCKQLMNLSIEEFKRSIDRFNKFDLNSLDRILTRLRVWLSGAVTYQETCLDAFENTTTDASKKMQGLLQTSMHMTNNGLSIINDLAKTLRDTRQQAWAPPPELYRCGNFTNINDALKSVPKKNLRPYIIYIKEGLYNEYVEVVRNMTHVVMIGDGGKKTRITGSKNFVDGVGTFRTASAAILGDFFVGIGIGFENTAGPEKHQAVALRVQSDRSIFYKCRMDGYQDTLYARTMRQFYRDCVISGTIDFVFGDAVADLQNCTFVVRKPLTNQQCIVTAQGRKEVNQPSGLVIHGGSIVSDVKYYPYRFDNKAYLARPWKNFSRTIFMGSYIGDLITPDGYMLWQTLDGFSRI